MRKHSEMRKLDRAWDNCGNNKILLMGVDDLVNNYYFVDEAG